MSFTNSFEVYVANEDLIFKSGTSVHLQWSPESILSTDIVGSDMYNVDIELFELNVTSGKWEVIYFLSFDIENSGSAEVTIPDLSKQTLEDNGQRSEDPISPVVIGVSLSSGTPRSTIIEKVLQRGLKTFKYTPVRYLVKTALDRVGCKNWSLTQPENIGDEIKQHLPPCPTTLSAIKAPNSGFREERLSSIVKFVGTIPNYLGTTVIDDVFQTYFHPNADMCFRQTITSK